MHKPTAPAPLQTYPLSGWSDQDYSRPGASLHPGRVSPGPQRTAECSTKCRIRTCWWPSPVAQWLRIRLPTQGTRARSLVREDSTCLEATEPAHNYRSPRSQARVLQHPKPVRREPALGHKRGPRNEQPAHCNRAAPAPAARESPRATGPNTTKNNQLIIF